MSPSPEAILQRVASRVVPSKGERAKMVRLSEKFRGEVDSILRTAGIDTSVSIQGSVARDTWLSGEHDLDIFASFSPKMERREWTEKVLPAIRKGLRRYRMVERYAEHPFLEFHAEGVRINVVPSYAVEKGEWKSATDRTLFHTEYMNAHLSTELRLEARLLKKFMKGIRTYGAEIRVGGFSGMLIETLILNYRSFLETLKQASQWSPGIFLQIEKSESARSKEVIEGLKAELVVIDPVDPNRNLASAVRTDKLWNFVAAGREFLRRPGLWYFYPREFTGKTRGQFEKQMNRLGHEIVAMSFQHPGIVIDVLWGQLMRLERSVVNVMAREDFQVHRSGVWSDEKRWSAILLEADRVILPPVKTHTGPPVWKRQDSQSFLDRHLSAKDTLRGPRVEKERWIVDKKRRVSSIRDLSRASARDPTYGLTVPKQLEKAFRRSVRLLRGREVLSLRGKDGFDEALWQFLEAKPPWLKTGPS